MRVYYFMPEEYVLSNIKEGRIKVSRISELNDPFELFSMDLRGKENRRKFRKAVKKIDDKYGIICFCKNWHNPVLWSHYADKHQGVCLGFDISEKIYPITYVKDRLAQIHPEKLKNDTIDGKTMIRLLTTKYIDWKYEREVRIGVELKQQIRAKNKYFREFGSNLVLREVILGANFKGDPQSLKNALQNYSQPVALIHARKAFRSFRIVTHKPKTKKLTE